jgi:tetratricopeptide (TPR) repeat protein
MGQLIKLIEWILELVLNFRMAEKNLQHAMSQRSGSQMMLQAYSSGDYQNSLAACDIGAQCGMNLGVFRGSVLMQLGRLDEAEQVLSQALPLEKEPKSTALAQCTLGELFLVQQRYEKALECFMIALRLWPERGATHRDIAEVGLRRGDKPSDVLGWARLAVEKEKSSQGIVPMTKVMNLGLELATLAWAVAVSSRNAPEVEKLVTEADSFCAGIPVTSRARVHFYSGMAYASLGDEAKRAQHFEAAAQVDPNGAWGREAQKLTAVACH